MCHPALRWPSRSRIQIGPMSVNDICCMIPPWFGSTVPRWKLIRHSVIDLIARKWHANEQKAQVILFTRLPSMANYCMLSWVCTQCALSIRLHCMLQVPMISNDCYGPKHWSLPTSSMAFLFPSLTMFCWHVWHMVWSIKIHTEIYIYIYCICTYAYIIVCLLWFAAFINLHSLLYVIHTHRIWLYNLIYVEKKQPNPIVMKIWCFGASYTYKSYIYIYIYLVGGLEHLLFLHILGISSSQLTFIFFNR